MPPLYPHQVEAEEAVLEALSIGVRRMGVSLPTGSGKIRIMLRIIKLLADKNISKSEECQDEIEEIYSKLPPAEFAKLKTLLKKKKSSKKNRGRLDRGQFMIVVTGAGMPEQIRTQAQLMLGHEWVVETEQGEHIATGRADLTIATRDSLIRRMEKYDASNFTCVIVDEAHHACSDGFLRVLYHFNADVESPIAVRRQDDPYVSCLLASVQEMAHAHATVSPIRLESAFHRLDFNGAEMSSYKDCIPSQRAQLFKKSNNVAKVVEYYRGLEPRPRSTLIFCADLEHIASLHDAFQASGIFAPHIRHDTPMRQRIDVIKDFQDGEIPILLNCGVLTEGADIPAIDCLIRLRPSYSLIRIVQEAGRAFRLSPQTGKTECHIVDFCDVDGKLERALDADLDEDYMLDGKAVACKKEEV
ncbi:hypothetical protein P7C73_g5345, partial [Tremellales sp. Uapishka_1]